MNELQQAQIDLAEAQIKRIEAERSGGDVTRSIAHDRVFNAMKWLETLQKLEPDNEHLDSYLDKMKEELIEAEESLTSGQSLESVALPNIEAARRRVARVEEYLFALK